MQPCTQATTSPVNCRAPIHGSATNIAVSTEPYSRSLSYSATPMRIAVTCSTISGTIDNPSTSRVHSLAGRFSRRR